MAKPKRAPRLQPAPPSLPFLRMFGLGLLAVAAVVWALLRPKRPWPQQITSPAGEIEVDLLDASYEP